MHRPLLLSLLCIPLAACLTLDPVTSKLPVDAPPLYRAEELHASYQIIANVEVRRRMLGTVEQLTATDIAWGEQSLRREASRLGADAVILRDQSLSRDTFLLIPYTAVTAHGAAILFTRP
ncbi:MAG TPA: hypothetical protein VFR01_01100 [Geobacterales bacterium]|nr:hypothetical protein [Geobacterales bacterium]